MGYQLALVLENPAHFCVKHAGLVVSCGGRRIEQLPSLHECARTEPADERTRLAFNPFLHTNAPRATGHISLKTQVYDTRGFPKDYRIMELQPLSGKIGSVGGSSGGKFCC